MLRNSRDPGQPITYDQTAQTDPSQRTPKLSSLERVAHLELQQLAQILLPCC